MNLSNTVQLLIEYRYLILIPLAIIEGPIVAFIAGTLASLGYFNIYVLSVFFFIRDVGMDSLFYSVGYFGTRTALAQRLLRKLHVTEQNLDGIRLLWEHHPMSTMFIGKISFGLGSTFVFIAGTVKMRFATFFKYGSIVAATQYWTLLALGYFFGNSFGGNISNILSNIEYLIAGISIVVMIYYFVSWRLRRRLLNEAEGEEEVQEK